MWWISLAAWAEAPHNPFREPDEATLARLEQELVTVVSRYAQTARKAPSIVTVITADQITASGYRTLSDVLRTIPGIYIWKSQEGRDLAALRGVVSADNNKLLLLVDGQPWYDGGYTHAWIDQYLPLAQVAQIEVIQGPGSAIYGTNAFTGVIHVVTRDAESLQGGQARWTVGSVGSSELSGMAGATRRVGPWEARATVSVRTLDQQGDGLDTTPEGAADILGADPKKGFHVGARVQVGDLRVHLDHIDYSHTYLPGAVDAPLDVLAKQVDTFSFGYHDTYLRADWTLDVSRALTLRPVLWGQRNDDPGSYFYGGSFETLATTGGALETTQSWTTVETEKDTRRWGATLESEARPGLDHVLVAGLGVENTEVLRFADVTFTSPDPTGVVSDFRINDDCGAPAGYGDEPCGRPAIRNAFAFAQHTWTASPAVELTAGLRADKRIPVNTGESATDGAFALAVSPRLGLLLVPTEQTTVKLLYGRAFRAPSAREMLVRATLDNGEYPFASGNVDLRPEQIDTIETEVAVTPTPWLTVRGDASYSSLQNEIDKVSPPNRYENLDGALGVLTAEGGVRWTKPWTRGGVAYAWTQARYADLGPYAGRPQYEFPPHMGKADMSVGPDDTSLTALAELYSSRPRAAWSPDAGLADGPAFGLLHLAAAARGLGPDERVTLSASVRNLLDTGWGTAGAYRDDANQADDQGRPDIPGDFEGEGRMVLGTIAVRI